MSCPLSSTASACAWCSTTKTPCRSSRPTSRSSCAASWKLVRRKQSSRRCADSTSKSVDFLQRPYHHWLIPTDTRAPVADCSGSPVRLPPRMIAVWGYAMMWWRRFGALGALGVFLLLPHPARPDPAAGASIPIASDAILPDPGVRLGVLPNGLRYAIMQNATPKGALSIRLGMEVGDFEENDGEHGVAHFIEHMAFSGGDNEHEAGPEKAFADAGVAFGRDLNADTSTFATAYRLDLPKADSPSLDLAFSWLRRVADGATFSDAAVNRERGIILAERATRLTPLLEASEATEEFVGPNLRSTRPHAIGTIAELQAIDGAKLLAFYRRWYRPDNAVLVVI